MQHGAHIVEASVQRGYDLDGLGDREIELQPAVLQHRRDAPVRRVGSRGDVP